ncbi:MAG: alanine--tRNA ligase-related protein [Candidatus Taylorbacteria bacterium]|nr:alanine--tRNA ligase-related protein [Candidatus Taylorbacteria bacterium]
MESTKLIYLEDFTLLDADSKVLAIAEENGRDIVILDQTIFYPQGGGQPYDKGIINGSSAKFIVEEVRFVDGIVKHIGKFEVGSFKEEEGVRCAVHKERRELNSRIHSAGHVVDMAIYELKLNGVPGKGYHFPEGPYVEYSGNLEGLDKEKLKADIESLCNKFIKEGRQTKVLFMDKSRMKEFCHFVPDYIPEGKPARIVMYGDFGVPCGGTHVSNLSDIKEMTIRKIKPEGSSIRIGYDVSR